MPVIFVTEPKYICLIAKFKSYMAFLPAVCITVGIAILSLTESSYMPSVSLNDKLAHSLLYALLAATWLMPLLKQSQTTSNDLKRSLTILLGTTAYGALLELLQHCCTLTRSGEWRDLLADFLGALIGIAILFVISSLRRYAITKK